MAIKIERIVGPSIEQWQMAIEGMRNPMNSWEKSDSSFFMDPYSHEIVSEIGSADLELMRKLVKAGSDHRKFLRQLPVIMNITAPSYWAAEQDTYKVGTVRNSCSFMHRGCAKPFEITDFSVHDDRIYEVLSPLPKKHYPLRYPYETDEYKYYECENGRKYKVFKNGRVFACEHEYTDTMGRHRVFEEKECMPSETAWGYYELNMGGRSGEKWSLHRLVATVWCDNPNNYETVDHIDCDKGNNSAENLQWCSLEDNIKKGYRDGKMENTNSLHCLYIRWKCGHRAVSVETKLRMKKDYASGIVGKALAYKYGVNPMSASNIIHTPSCVNNDLFVSCYYWEKIIDGLNALRDEYLETKDENVFLQLRDCLPQGYNQRYTWSANYEVLLNIYQARKNHRLPEWRTFCDTIVRKVPHFAEIFEIENDGTV